MGDNPERLNSEAAFAALCGVSPIEYSSSRRSTRRLDHGGDRQANAVPHRMVFTRLRHDPRAQTYDERRSQEGENRRESVRCLRAICRPRGLPPGQTCAVATLGGGAAVRRERV
ncbi:IS110 family transposase [Streptomyces misionensis]|uniref:IS110 family transposase n=1 Tax=Streptomyces misionensis TaxID=67331 RepID=UPI001FC96707|nr:IS110 family transposase [Streptomyces misionensis]